MAQEPKKRHSKARKRTRRASIMLKTTNLIKCPSCQALTLPHQVCKNCGKYLSKEVKAKKEVKVTRA